MASAAAGIAPGAGARGIESDEKVRMRGLRQFRAAAGATTVTPERRG